jgi:hypothetical protein
MSTDEELASCQAAREGASAHRDGEAFEDTETVRHRLGAAPAPDGPPSTGPGRPPPPTPATGWPAR